MNDHDPNHHTPPLHGGNGRHFQKGVLELSLHPSAIAGLLVVFTVLIINASEFIERSNDPQDQMREMTRWILLAGVASAAVFYHLTEILQETNAGLSKALHNASRLEFWLRVSSQLALLVSADLLVHEHWVGFVVSFGIFFVILIVWDVLMWKYLGTGAAAAAARIEIVMKDVIACLGALLICVSLITWMVVTGSYGPRVGSMTGADSNVIDLNSLVVAGAVCVAMCAVQTVLSAVTRWRAEPAK